MTIRLHLSACALALLGGCAHPPPPPEPRRPPPPPVAAQPAPPPETAPAPASPAAPPPVAAAPAPIEVQKPRRKVAHAPSPVPTTAAPAPRADFDRVQLGMTPSQVTAVLGAPTSHATAGDKAAVPGRPRVELRYAGVGRLEFAGARAGAPDTARLVRIVPDTADAGGR